MEPIQVMQNEYVTVWFHPDGKIVHHRLEKYPDSATFRAMLTKGAECMEFHHAHKWLSDDRKHIVVRDADAEWGAKVWTPRVMRAGFKYWGIVVPSAAIGQLNLARLAEEYRRLGVVVQTFSDVESALKWLRSV